MTVYIDPVLYDIEFKNLVNYLESRNLAPIEVKTLLVSAKDYYNFLSTATTFEIQGKLH